MKTTLLNTIVFSTVTVTAPDVTAAPEALRITSEEKFTPKPIDHISLDELTRSTVVTDEPLPTERERLDETVVRRVAPKDDVFVSSTTTMEPIVAAPLVVEHEVQGEALREATSESFEVEPAITEISTTVVPAEIILTAERENLELSTSQKFTPEPVHGLSLEELIQTVTEIPVAEEPIVELRQREVTDLEHRVSPKDDMFVTSIESVKPAIDVERLAVSTGTPQLLYGHQSFVLCR